MDVRKTFEQITDYFPFGWAQTELGFNLLDYHARFYDILDHNEEISKW